MILLSECMCFDMDARYKEEEETPKLFVVRQGSSRKSKFYGENIYLHYDEWFETQLGGPREDDYLLQGKGMCELRVHVTRGCHQCEVYRTTCRNADKNETIDNVTQAFCSSTPPPYYARSLTLPRFLVRNLKESVVVRIEPIGCRRTSVNT